MRITSLVVLFTCVCLGMVASASDPAAHDTSILQNMRERMRAMEQISEALNRGDLTTAADLAQKYLPLPETVTANQAMAQVAADFQHQVDQFLTTLATEGVTTASQALSILSQQCMSCHTERGLQGQEGLKRLQELRRPR